MADNIIELKSVGELSGKHFFIPSYQRGYRWTGQQVKDLLDDIEEFRKNSKGNGFYCLQPLVVKECSESNDALKATLMPILSEKTGEENFRQTLIDTINRSSKWEVIDGQQRLTTLCILLTYLTQESPYEIEYETRNGSAGFLEHILEKKQNDANGNVDYYHMFLVKSEIERWLKDKNETAKTELLRTICDRVKFIWYELGRVENSIEVFTRLNIGKIKLTNAELIKALMLNRSNFAKDDSLTLRQQEIASQWDQIEYTLQDDAFWLFLHSEKYKPATRIDFIFDLICDNDPWGIYTAYVNKKQTKVDTEKNKRKKIGTDEYQTFRYFYEYFHVQGEDSLEMRLQNCWSEVKRYFHVLQEWYNDLTLYHYIAYLLYLDDKQYKERIRDLISRWNENNKNSFKKSVKDNIKDLIPSAIKILSYEYSYDDNKSENKLDKRNSIKILLLHNIQTVILQNEKLADDKRYSLSVYYKFPFHLLKKEKWDVEHIDSSTTNDLDKYEDQKIWLDDVWEEYGSEYWGDELVKRIDTFKEEGKEKNEDFDTLWRDIWTAIKNVEEEPLKSNEKNQIWNFCLLNAGTNRSYRNAIFPKKRLTIINKEQGIILDNNKKSSSPTIAFVPPVTKHVFLKYYTPKTKNFRTWNRTDAQAYRDNIYETLKDFGIENR